MGNFEAFKNFAAAIQSVVVCFSILFSGAWAIMRFHLLEDVVSLDLTIDTQRMSAPGGGDAALITVSVGNKGSRDVFFDLTRKPLFVQKLRLDEDGVVVADRHWRLDHPYSLPHGGEGFTITGRQKFAPGSSRKLVFYSPLDGPGVYLATFRAPLDGGVEGEVAGRDSQPNAVGRSEVSSNDPDAWSATTYFEIGARAVQ